MGNKRKLLDQILGGRADANVRFNDLCNLLIALGFKERIKSSHHIFSKTGIEEIINLQSDGGKSKPYQVKQFRNLIVKYQLGGSLND